MSPEPAPPPLLVHASTVCVAGRGLLITGKAGTGKSSLALQLIALGAELVADDGTLLSNRDGALIARPPESIQGRIEARGLGVLAAHWRAEAGIVAVVDLSRPESKRFPPRREITFAGVTVPLVLGQRAPYFPAALRHYILHGRID